jgi:DNA-binding GntR family transcriptional regulator
MSKAKKPKQTMQQKVYQELRHSLMVGAFTPGQTISLRKLADSLQTSLMPVREAVNRLIAERAFEMQANRTVIVPSLDEEKLAELMRWRKILEGAATKEACPKITPSIIKKIETINNELLQAVEDNELQLTLTKNQEFHFEIYQASGNNILLPMIESLWLQGGPFMFYSLASPQVAWDGSHHLEAIQAFKDNDSDAAQKVIENDIQTITDFLLKSHLFRKVAPRAIK